MKKFAISFAFISVGALAVILYMDFALDLMIVKDYGFLKGAGFWAVVCIYAEFYKAAFKDKS